MNPFLKTSEIRIFFSKVEGRNLFFNFTQFGIYQVINYLVPLITIPYLLRTIGIAKFGIISFALAFIYYLQIFVDYGFSITGIQMIAQSKRNHRKQSEIISNVLVIQIIIYLLCLVILMFLCFFVKRINEHALVYLFSYCYIFANILMFVWYFVGIEKIKYINIINSTSKILYVILIILFIRKENDYIWVPILNFCTALFASLISVILMVEKFEIRFIKPKMKLISQYLKDGWHIFISNIAMNLYRNTNVLILGIVATDASVGIYSAGEKVIKAFQSALSPITQTIYPFISRKKVENPTSSLRFISKILVMMCLLGGMISILLIVFSEKIAFFLNGKINQSLIYVIRFASFVVLFGGLNFILGIIFMTNFDMKKEFLKSVIIVGIINIIMCYFLCCYFSEVGGSISLTLSEGFLSLLLSYFIIKNRKKWMSNV